jgi:hypothetical protein
MAKRRASQDDGTPTARLDVKLPRTGLNSIKYWRNQLDLSQRRIKKELNGWRANIARYAGAKPTLPGVPPEETINVNVQFYTTELKKPQLFYQIPAIALEARQGAVQVAAPIFRQILNDLLGPKAIDAAELFDELLSDVMIPSGFAVSKLGYVETVVNKSVPTNRMVPMIDPATKQPVIDPVTGMPQEVLATDDKGRPETETVPHRIHEEYFWRRISPSRLVLPVGFLSQRYQEAPFVGWKFPVTEAMLSSWGAGVDVDTMSGIDPDETLAGPNDREFLRDLRVGEGIEIFYKASLFDPKEKNPEKIRQLILVRVQGASRRSDSLAAVVHRDLPAQRFDDDGALVQGPKGFPIRILTIHKMPDAPFPNSDCTTIRDVADEKSIGRSQMVQQRRRNLPLRAFDRLRMKKDTIQRIEQGDWQGMIPFEGPITDDLFCVISQAHYPTENFKFDEITQHDIDRLAAAGANQQATVAQGDQTATASALIQRAADTVISKQRDRVLGFFMGGVEYLSSLVQVYSTYESVLQMVGEDGAQQIVTWDKETIRGTWAFSAKPDSAVRINAAEERDQTVKGYNLLANEPWINRQELVRLVVEKLGWDAAKLVLKQLPEKPPEAPRVTVSIQGKDLFDPYVQKLLEQFGLKLALLPEQPPGMGGLPALGAAGHGGPSAQVSPINKHVGDLTGERPGPAPLQ